MWFIDEGLRHKIHAAADGTFFLGTDADAVTDYEFEDAKSVASFTDDGWCVEVALPMTNLAAGKEFSYTLQVNNILDELALSGSASGSQAGDYPFVCVADAVALPEPEPAPAPVVEEPAPEPVAEPEPEPAPVVEVEAEEVIETPVEEVVEAVEEPAEVVEVAEAPQTFDLGVIAAVSALVSLAGFTFTKKK